ncbi:MAG TPA: zinc-binding dehydrogenase [Candidatus Acidoferrum sp.]
MADSIQGLRPDGRFIVMGADAEPRAVSVVELLFKRIRIIGSQQNGPEYLYEALDYVAQGKVKTVVETYPLAEAAKAYQRVVEGSVRFRAVLAMHSPPISGGSRARKLRRSQVAAGDSFSTVCRPSGT